MGVTRSRCLECLNMASTAVEGSGENKTLLGQNTHDHGGGCCSEEQGNIGHKMPTIFDVIKTG